MIGLGLMLMPIIIEKPSVAQAVVSDPHTIIRKFVPARDLRPENRHTGGCYCYGIIRSGQPPSHPWFNTTTHYNYTEAAKVYNDRVVRPDTCPGACARLIRVPGEHPPKEVDSSPARISTQHGEIVWETDNYARYGSSGGGRLIGEWDGSTFYGYWAKDSAARRCTGSIDGTDFWGRFELNFSANRKTFRGSYSRCDGPLEAGWNSTGNLRGRFGGTESGGRVNPPPPPPPIDDDRFRPGTECGVFGLDCD